MADAVATATRTATLGWAGRHSDLKEQVKKSCKTLQECKCQKLQIRKGVQEKTGQIIFKLFQSYSLWVFIKHIGIDHRHTFSPDSFGHFPKTKARVGKEANIYLWIQPLKKQKADFQILMLHNIYFSQKRTQELAHLIMPEIKSTMEDKWLGLIIDFCVSSYNNIILFVILWTINKQKTFNTNCPLLPHIKRHLYRLICLYAITQQKDEVHTYLSFSSNANISSFLITSLFSFANLFTQHWTVKQ